MCTHYTCNKYHHQQVIWKTTFFLKQRRWISTATVHVCVFFLYYLKIYVYVMFSLFLIIWWQYFWEKTNNIFERKYCSGHMYHCMWCHNELCRFKKISTIFCCQHADGKQCFWNVKCRHFISTNLLFYTQIATCFRPNHVLTVMRVSVITGVVSKK